MALSLPPLAAGNPLLPPVRPSLDFPELEVETPLWPYEDLNIKGQYNRWPQIPGDIIPTASILIGPGDDKPHAAQFTKDRRLKVDAFISGGGGGGGGPTPVGMGLDTIIYLPGVVSVSKQIYGGWYPLGTLYAMTWGIYYDLSTSPTFPITGRVGVGWSNNGDTLEIPTHTFFVAAQSADAAAALSQTWTYTFPVPMDLNVTLNHLQPSTRIYPYCNNVSTATVIPWVQVYLSPL